MKAINETAEFIRKNKLRTAGCILLEILRFIIVIIILVSILPKINQKITAFNGLLDSAPSEKEESLEYLTQHVDEIEQSEAESKKEIMNLTLWIIVVNTIFLVLFFALLFRKTSVGFIIKYIIASIAMFGSVFMVISIFFGKFVEYSTESLIVPEKSKIMYIIPLLAILIIYFLFTVIFVELRHDKLKAIVRNIVTLFRTRTFGMIGRFILIETILFTIIILTFLLTVLGEGFFSFLLSIILVLFILIPSLAIAKIYLSNYIIIHEKK